MIRKNVLGKWRRRLIKIWSDVEESNGRLLECWSLFGKRPPLAFNESKTIGWKFGSKSTLANSFCGRRINVGERHNWRDIFDDLKIDEKEMFSFGIGSNDYFWRLVDFVLFDEDK